MNFRQFVRIHSAPLHVSGFVRNLPDGTVEAELEGELDEVRQLERAILEEHPRARIDRIDREEIAPQGSRPPVEVH